MTADLGGVGDADSQSVQAKHGGSISLRLPSTTLLLGSDDSGGPECLGGPNDLSHAREVEVLLDVDGIHYELNDPEAHSSDSGGLLSWDDLEDLQVKQWPQKMEVQSASSSPVDHLALTGAVIEATTSAGSYRFVVPGATLLGLGPQVTILARTFHGAQWKPNKREDFAPETETGRWLAALDRARPLLIFLLIALFATAVVLVLLQSAGTIDLPWLGGSTNPAALRGSTAVLQLFG